MNRDQIEEQNYDGLENASSLLDDLSKKPSTPYVNSVIVAKGLFDTANQIFNGFDEGYHTHELTPLQRQIFVMAYLEILIGFIGFALSEHGMPESIGVPK